MNRTGQKIRCRLGRHNLRFVGLTWVEDTPWLKSAHDHVCIDCGKQVWLGHWRAT